MKIEENKELKALNTFGIEAKAKKYVRIDSFEDAQAFFKQKEYEEPILILGGGSNILLTEDFNGTVINNHILGIDVIEESEESITLKVGAGENWHEFVLYCIEQGYAGVENLSLIPGKVGASPMQNIGAYGVEVKEVITEVECLRLADAEKVIFTNEECKFDYRSSIFKTTHKGQYFITSVSFKLNKIPTFKVSYGAIQAQLLANGVDQEHLSIKAISDAVIQIRQSKLPDPKEIGNSGSFFKNPIVSKEKFLSLKKRFKDMPAYELPQGGYKLAAGWLIEKAGWKGYTEENYGVHKKQALVLVNYGGASGKEIYDLSERILQSIIQKFGVELEREVNVI